MTGTHADEDAATNGLAKTPSQAHSHHSHHSRRSHHSTNQHHHNHHTHGHQKDHKDHKAAGAGANAAVVKYGYPHGHLGHLTEEEEEAFGKFKAFIAEKGLYKPGPPPSHDDPTLLRFLRARRWVVQDAYQQFKDTEAWRAENQIDVLYDTIDLDAYEQSRRLYPQWTGRRDKRGIPVYLFEIRHLDSKTIAAYEKSANNTYSRAHADGKTPPRLLRLFALYENLTRFAQPLCTQMPDREHARTTPITLSTNIVDVSGVSLRQFWNLKSHMQAASTLATANYPETLDRIFIIGAPMFFSTVWGWIKRWFDPVTVSKIFILGHHEVLPTLLSFIDRENVPQAYGGDLDFKWGQMPNLDPAIRERITWENGFIDFPKGPVYWRTLDDGSNRVECVAVGSVDQVDRMQRIGTMPKCYDGVAATLPEDAAAATPAATSNGHAEAKPDEPKEGKTAEKAASDETAVPVAAVEALAISEKTETVTEEAVVASAKA